MAQMVTRCPACGTRFRVVPDQLRVSQGWVRCGQCAEVFDAAAQLAAAQAAPAMPGPLPVPAPSDLPPLHAAPPPAAQEPARAELVQDIAPDLRPGPPPLDADTEPATLQPRDDGPSSVPPSPPLPVPEDAPQWLPHAPAEIPVTDPVASLDLGLAEFVQAQAGDLPSGTPNDTSNDTPSDRLDERPVEPPADAPVPPEQTVLREPPDASDARQAPEPVSAPTGAGDLLPAGQPGRLVVGLAPEAIALPLRTAAATDDRMPLPQRPAVQAARPAPAPPRIVAAPPVAQPVPLDPELAELSFLRDGPAPGPADAGAGAPRRARRLWSVLAAVLLLVALLWQLAVHERDRLAASAPALRPVLEALCAPFGCSVQSPRRIDALVIDGSSFHALGENGYRLSLTLRNGAAHAVAMPAIALALTDLSEQAVVRRVLMPQDLAAPPALLAHGEWNASVDLQLADNAGRARVVGYRLDLFYP